MNKVILMGRLTRDPENGFQGRAEPLRCYCSPFVILLIRPMEQSKCCAI